MPYISINSPRGEQSFDVTQAYIDEHADSILQMVGGGMEAGKLILADGYGNLVAYGPELLRQSIITFGGVDK